MKKIIVILISLFVGMAFADNMRNGTGFFVNREYIVTAYHVVENFGHTCYYDVERDTCYQTHIVDYDVDKDLVLLKLDEEPENMPMVCRLANNELPVGEKLTSYGYPEPLIEHGLTIKYGMSGGPNFTTDGRVGAVSKSVATNERNTSNLIKSTEVLRMMNRNGVVEYPNTKNVRKCAISILNSDYLFRRLHTKGSN